MTLTRVDLPAPLSPTRATISPAWTSTDAPSSAWTEPKDLVMFRIEISGVPRLARGEATAAEWGCVLAMIDLLGGERGDGAVAPDGSPSRHWLALHTGVLWMPWQICAHVQTPALTTSPRLSAVMLLTGRNTAGTSMNLLFTLPLTSSLGTPLPASIEATTSAA